MNVAYINPFIESVSELFTTMLSCSAQRGNVGVVRTGGTAHDLTAVIGLSGPVRGTVALSFPMPTASAMVARMMGLPEDQVQDSLSDGLAELVNIVAGGAKAKLNAGGAVTDLSLPTVVQGQQYAVQNLAQTMWLDVQFASDLGPFCLRVTLAQVEGCDVDKDQNAELVAAGTGEGQ